MPVFNLIHKEITGSTNNDLKDAVRASAEKLYICEYADIQTGGKGRRGRSFSSPAGGIYFSFTVPLQGNETNIPFLTSVAGLSSAQLIRAQTGADVKIKWPNDLYLDGKKISGMLAELVTDCRYPAIVMGIGINNRHTDFPDEIKDKAGCLEDFNAVITDTEAFVTAVAERVYKEVYENGVLEKSSPAIAAELRCLSCSIGREALYNGVTGTVKDINDDGSLLMDFGGVQRTVSTGEIVHFDTSTRD